MSPPTSLAPPNHHEDNSSSHAFVYGVSFGVAALFFIFILFCDPRVRGCCRAKFSGTGVKNDNNPDHDDQDSSSSSPARPSPLPSLSELERKYHSHLRHSIVEVPKATKPRTAASPMLLSTSSVRKSFKNARKNLKMRQQQQHAPAEPDFHQHEHRQQSHHAFMMNNNAPTTNSVVVVPTTTASQKNAIVPLDDTTASENTNTQFVMVPSPVPFGGL